MEYAHKMAQARNDAVREVGDLRNLKSATLKIAAHESAAVYLPSAAAVGWSRPRRRPLNGSGWGREASGPGPRSKAGSRAREERAEKATRKGAFPFRACEEYEG